MSSRCEQCGKTGVAGRNVSHSKRSTPTRFLANIQRVSVVVDGQSRKMRLCTRCLRTLHKAPRR